MQRFFGWIAAVALLLGGCQTPSVLPSPFPSPSPTALPPTHTPPQPATAAPTLIPPTATAMPRILAERVLVISVDGLRADVVDQFQMPNTYALMQSGTYAISARTTFPSATLPSHSSMLTGMCPDKHGVYWNDYIPENGFAASPSILEIAHEAGLRTVMVVGKEKLRQITMPENTDVFVYVNDRDSVVAERAVSLIPEGFDLMFVHLPLVDGLGHAYGWLSPNYMVGTFRADEAIGMILAGLDEAGLREGTLIIVTADHGGHDTTHGSRLPEDVQIPWVITGASSISARVTRKISTVDTAATIAYALNLLIPKIWDGIPVYESFGDPAPERVERPCE